MDRLVILPLIVLILVLAFYFLLTVPGIDGLTRIGFLFVIGLLILGFGGGLAWDLLKGDRPALEVDGSGIRVMGAPWLDWSAVREVRAEEEVSFAGAETDSDWSIRIGGLTVPLGTGGVISLDEALASGAVSVRKRIGIVPKDPRLAGSGGLLGGIGRFAEGRRHKVAERMGHRAIDLAPIGIYEGQMLAEFPEVVAGIRRFHPVIEVSDLQHARAG